MMLGWLALALLSFAALGLAAVRLAPSLRAGGRAPDVRAALENLEQGVSVVDAKMRLVAWNRQYQRFFDYPEGLLRVGRPVADVIRFNARRGKFGAGPGLDIERLVRRRIAFMQAGSAYRNQRTLRSGRVLEWHGRPLPRGGYVTSYSDITDFKRTEREAELAQRSRTQFLMAVSHDVLQPINAARLFASALHDEDKPEAQRHLAERINTSLRAAEELLDGLLDISRLHAGALKPALSDFDVQPLLLQLADQYGELALRAGLQLRLHARGPIFIRSDPRLLWRMLQNLLANALRYTHSGRILLCARPRGGEVALQVWDTGPGIPAHQLRWIYDEFHRYEQPLSRGGQGFGLGLSICRRFAVLLAHTLDVRSEMHRGSVFTIRVPRVAAPWSGGATMPLAPLPPASLQGLRVLCLDNDPHHLSGLQALLERWQASVLCATRLNDALALMRHQPDVLLVDYHLCDRLDGLNSLDVLRAAMPGVRGALLSTDGGDALKHAARLRGYRVLAKPVKPASLRAFLSAQLRHQNLAP